METKRIVLVVIGAVIYMIASLVDKYLFSIDNMIYIPIVIIAILFMLVGIIKQGQD